MPAGNGKTNLRPFLSRSLWCSFVRVAFLLCFCLSPLLCPPPSALLASLGLSLVFECVFGACFPWVFRSSQFPRSLPPFFLRGRARCVIFYTSHNRNWKFPSQRGHNKNNPHLTHNAPQTRLKTPSPSPQAPGPAPSLIDLTHPAPVCGSGVALDLNRGNGGLLSAGLGPCAVRHVRLVPRGSLLVAPSSWRMAAALALPAGTGDK